MKETSASRSGGHLPILGSLPHARKDWARRAHATSTNIKRHPAHRLTTIRSFSRRLQIRVLKLRQWTYFQKLARSHQWGTSRIQCLNSSTSPTSWKRRSTPGTRSRRGILCRLERSSKTSTKPSPRSATGQRQPLGSVEIWSTVKDFPVIIAVSGSRC